MTTSHAVRRARPRRRGAPRTAASSPRRRRRRTAPRAPGRRRRACWGRTARVPGTSTNATVPPDGSVGPGEAEVDGQPAAPLLGQPVGVAAGERADQRATCRGRRARRWRRRACQPPRRAQHRGEDRRRRAPAARTAGRAGSGRARPGRRTAGSPARSGAARSSGRLTRPGRQLDAGRASAAHRPRPTAQSDRRAPAACSASRSARGRAARRDRRAAPACTRWLAGRAGSPPARPGSACPPAARGPADGGAAARRRRRRPSTSPACGPPSSLSPLAVTSVGPGAQGRRGVRLVGQQRVGREQPEPMSTHHGHAERGQLGDGHRAVKPLTAKFDGCTLSTKPVSGPTASA